MARGTFHALKDVQITGGSTIGSGAISDTFNPKAAPSDNILVAIHGDTNIIGATKTFTFRVFGRLTSEMAWVQVVEIDETDPAFVNISGNVGAGFEVTPFPDMYVELVDATNQADPTSINVFISL